MTKPRQAAPAKIILSASRDIPLDKLVLAQTNVRRIKAGQSIEELADDIARRTLLQSLSVRPILDETGAETGRYEVPAGGRRFRALQLLVKQKRLAKNTPIPCIVRNDGLAEEDSLAENVHREALHPLDQYRAFAELHAKGLGEEAIAARFFVTPQVVRQRLKLAAASPKLLDLYAADALTLEQLMAFCVSDDHSRQEQVWGAIQHGWNREPYHIRRLLTEDTVEAEDPRAVFVGIAAYEAAGGHVLRDLFHQDRGGWLQDAALLDWLAREKLDAEADAIRAEGWRWVSVSLDFPYGHTSSLRRIPGELRSLSDEERASLAALEAEMDTLTTAHEEDEELPDEVDARPGGIAGRLLGGDRWQRLRQARHQCRDAPDRDRPRAGRRSFGIPGRTRRGAGCDDSPGTGAAACAAASSLQGQYAGVGARTRRHSGSQRWRWHLPTRGELGTKHPRVRCRGH